MIALVHGPDRLLAREAVLAIAAELDPDGSNTSWLDARETPLERIVAAIGSASFFAAPRVVIVADLLARAGREDDSGQPPDRGDVSRPRALAGFDTLIQAVPDENCLILFEPGLTAPPAAFKTAAPGARVIAAEPPRGAALIAWIEAAAHRAGSEIDRRAAQSLAQTLFPQTWDRKPANPRYDRPPDMSLFGQEIEKLALTAYPGPITSQHVHDAISGGPDQRLFRFIDAALAGDLRAATGELERLAMAGEEPAMLLSQVLGQIELATVASAADERDAAAVARDLTTLTPARMSAVMASARSRRPRAATEAAAIGTSVDRRLKTGRIRQPVDALHDLVLALAENTRQQHGRSE